jgi:hypothetical protein
LREGRAEWGEGWRWPSWAMAELVALLKKDKLGEIGRDGDGWRELGWKKAELVGTPLGH